MHSFSCSHCKEDAQVLHTETKRLFCTIEHATLYHAGWARLLNKPLFVERATFHIGMKREHEEEEAAEPPAKELMMDLLEILPEDVMGEILLYVFPDFHETGRLVEFLEDVLIIRETSVKMRTLVDRYLLNPVKSLIYDDTMRLMDDDKLPLFTGLEELYLNPHASCVTDKGLIPLADHLKKLQLLDDRISDYAIQQLTNLQTLIIYDSMNRSEALLTLHQLKMLKIKEQNNTDDDNFMGLHSLERLVLIETGNVSGFGFRFLTCLTSLSLFDANIHEGVLLMLAGTLRELRISEYGDENDYHITDRVIAMMTGLEKLHISGCKFISDDGLIPLVNLKALSLSSENGIITDKALSNKTLTSIVIRAYNSKITFKGVVQHAKTLEVMGFYGLFFDDQLHAKVPLLREIFIDPHIRYASDADFEYYEEVLKKMKDQGVVVKSIRS